MVCGWLLDAIVIKLHFSGSGDEVPGGVREDKGKERGKMCFSD
jgi:hypothetical protein